MIEKVVVSMAQLNQTAGDLEGNFKRIAEAAEKAKHSDILVTPELSLCGYPPEDLLFLDSFLEDCAKKLNELVEYSTRFPKLHILAGYPLKEAGRLYNVVSVILNAAPQRIVYVSCNPATQARDLSLLDADYEVAQVQPVDMFPHTPHVENVVQLVRRS